MNGTTRREFLALTAGAGVAMAFGTRWNAALAEAVSKGRLLHRIDCTQDFPAERYFAHGNVQVVESPVGRYREAEAVPLSRFGYRFLIENVGRPHVTVIRYPDDKRRYMCIMDGTCYDLTTGVLTGWAQPLSNTMLELRQVFWPRSKDCSVIFTTWSEGEPASAASFEVWELDDLPALDVPCDPGDGTRRELGIQYEDPCGIGGAEGSQSFAEWTDRLTQYARHSGQNLLIYPMAWYHGPQFPSESEPASVFDWVVVPDRKQYTRWTTTPVDRYDRLLAHFDELGLSFQGALTLLRLGSLLRKMNIDLDGIKAGADTFNNMLCTNHVQSSTNDWTTIYNALNFKALTEENRNKQPLEPWSQTPSRWAYGEVNNPGHMGPMFNPLHPTVQEAILGFVAEIGQRYAKHRSFKGISFNMFASAMPWYGSIHSGYDDYSIALFEKETGTAIAVDPKAADRFSRRYEFLMSNHRSAWIDWRCRKIRELFGRIRQTLSAARADLRVTVTLWDETVLNNMGVSLADLQIHNRRSMLDWYREAGIDIDLYRDEPGLEVDRGMGNSRDRGGNGPDVAKGVNLSLEDSLVYRDFDFLDQPALDAYAKHNRPGAFIFNCWVEAWGEHRWFRPEDGDPNVTALSDMDGKPAEGIFRMNSLYPKDGFWWDSQLRITPAFPAGVHFLEPYAHAVAELDACRITRGGLFLDKAHTEAIRQFAVAYRALPRQKFATVGASSDPVVMRSLLHGGRRYFYAVNRDYYPVKVEVTFNNAETLAEDLATGEKIDLPQRWSLLLEPYQLRSFAAAAGTEVTGFTTVVPETILNQLHQEAELALAAMARLRAASKGIVGMDDMEQRMRTAISSGKFAWLRRALTGYIVRKCRALAETTF